MVQQCTHKKRDRDAMFSIVKKVPLHLFFDSNIGIMWMCSKLHDDNRYLFDKLNSETIAGNPSRWAKRKRSGKNNFFYFYDIYIFYTCTIRLIIISDCVFVWHRFLYDYFSGWEKECIDCVNYCSTH